VSVGIQISGIIDEIGSADFFGSFFATIAVNLEGERWGSKFPIVMKKLYAGKIVAGDANRAETELRQIQKELAKFPPRNVIWDFDDRAAQPPWGDKIAPTITDLSNYFVTSTGRDLFELLLEVVTEVQSSGEVAEVVNY